MVWYLQSFFRLFRAIKRWEWAIGYSYFAGCSPVTLDDSNSSFLLRDSISVPVSTPLHKKNPNTTVNRSSSAKTNQNSIQKRLPFSPCRPPPAPGASPTKKTVVAEAYPNPPCRKTDMLVNPQVDGTQGICAKEFLEEPVIDQLYIHDCASTMGLFHITFG